MTAALLDGWFQFDLGEGAFYAAFGFVFVFCGIALLILIFTLLGLVMKNVNGRREKREPAKPRREVRAVEAPPLEGGEEGIPPEVIAVISAAVAACLGGQKAKCDFVVRRIKRL